MLLCCMNEAKEFLSDEVVQCIVRPKVIADFLGGLTLIDPAMLRTDR